MSKLILTTSRRTHRRIRSFLKDLAQAIPHSHRINRGHTSIPELASLAQRIGAYGVAIVLGQKANPSGIRFYRLEEAELIKTYTIRITSVKLLRETPDSQKPLNTNRLVIRTHEIPTTLSEKVLDALINTFRPAPIEGEPQPTDVELVIAGEGEKAIVTFLCGGTGKPCGPSFKVFKVVEYEGGGEGNGSPSP